MHEVFTKLPTAHVPPLHPLLADLGEVVALVTLASPPTFPRFMPHAPLAAPPWLSGPSAACSVTTAAAAEAAAAAGAAAAEVPHASILAGAGDFSLPHTHAPAATLAGHVAHVGGRSSGEVTLLMRDMPGVWTTCSHKVRWGRCWE